MNQIRLSTNNLEIGYKAKSLYKTLALELKNGELTCFLGCNGAGKSSLMRTLSALQAPLSGIVYLNGTDITTYSPAQLAQQIGLVLTDQTLSGALRVHELVALGRHPFTGFFGKLNERDQWVIQQALKSVGMDHYSNELLAYLSDGERQKVLIAKALAQECPIIMLDEPTAFLDVGSRNEMMYLLHQLAHQEQKAIIMSTHDMELALQHADRLVLMSRNLGVTTGYTEDLVLDGAINRYFGSTHLQFDLPTASFRSTYKRSKLIYLEAEGSYFTWGKNALERNGFDITLDVFECDFGLKISPNKLFVISKEGVPIAHCNTFEEAIKLLVSNF